MGERVDQWLLERIREGVHSAVVGEMPAVGGPDDDLLALRVVCDGPATTWGPLEDARRAIEQLLGESFGPPRGARELRLFRVLGEPPDHVADFALVAACNRLEERSGGHATMVLEGVDGADDATLDTLGRLLAHPARVRLPLILAFRRPPEGPAADLLELMRSTLGADAVRDLAPRGEQPPTEQVPFDWHSLPESSLRVLRAASVMGPVFEIDWLAELLDEPPGRILQELQQAADLGAPIADRGDGTLWLPPDAGDELQRDMLPSLVSHWHRRLGDLLAEEPPPPGILETPSPPPPEPGDEGGEAVTGPAPTSYADAFDTGEAVSGADSAEPELEPQSYRPPPPSLVDTARGSRDPARAAEHFVAAGDLEAALQGYVDAIREISDGGDARRGLLLADRALDTSEHIPPSPLRSLWRGRVLLERARLQWHGAGFGEGMSLSDARESIDAAASELRDGAPATLRSEIAAVKAGICYDTGDLRSLETALEELSRTARVLLSEGQASEAARLFNDQAALYLRVGDPVRAVHLLERARDLYEGLSRGDGEDPGVAAELAATDHLLARVPLHARARPGREEDAMAMGLDHALAAARTYQRLERPRELARVWETMGRLELERGHADRARQRLSAALDAQRKLGDVTGLARTSAALSDLLRESGLPLEAASLLEQSAALNLEKGSPIGLAFNRRAYDALVERIRDTHASDPDVDRALARVGALIDQGEDVLGHPVLPQGTDLSS